VLGSSPDETHHSIPALDAAGQARVIALDTWQATVIRSIGSPGGPVIGLGDWSVIPGLADFSGTCSYTTTLDLDNPTGPATLDLGRVGEAAQVRVNGQIVCELPWAPYVANIPENVLVPRQNTVEVLVSNSAANHYEGLRSASGLMGPVRLSVRGA
jgi:hypothetical protein